MIAIVGGGISGLTAAYYLQKAGIPYKLFEKNERAGGVIYSQRDEEGNLLEYGPNSLLLDQALKTLIDDLNINDRVVEAAPVNKSRFVLRKGVLSVLPTSPLQFLAGGFFSFKTKMAVLRELRGKFPKAPTSTESIADFIKRHFNQEIVDYALQPFVRGIYNADANDISTAIAFKQLPEIEKKYGSILKGMIKESGKQRKITFSFKDGLYELITALIRNIEHIEYETKVTSLSKTTHGWTVNYTNKDGVEQQFEADKIVLSCPAYVASELLAHSHAELTTKLAEIAYPPISAIHTIYDRKHASFHFNGFGALYPKSEQTTLSGSIWNSSLFAHRSSKDQLLMTNFVPTDKPNIDNAIADLTKIYRFSANPIKVQCYSYTNGIPLYNTHLASLQKEIETLNNEQIYVLSNWYKGVSVPDCIKNAVELVDRIKEN